MTKIQITPSWSEVKPCGNYVYLHCRESDGEPFYVGLGQGRRGWVIRSGGRSDWWKRIATKHGVKVLIAQDNMERRSAVLLEMWLIAKLRHEGVKLCNITDGGEGCLGHSRSRTDAERSKLRSAKGVSEVCCSNGMIFGTSRDACDWIYMETGKKARASAINLACAGGIMSAYGFAWWRLGESPREVLDGRVIHGLKNKIKVSCSDGTTHESAKDAANYMVSLGYPKASSSAVSSACRGRIGSAYGRSWWYADSEEIKYVPRYVRSAMSNKRH